MNCKLKLHSERFYYKILGTVTVRKFLQTLALDFPYQLSAIFPGKFCTGKCRENFKKQFQRMQLHVTTSNSFRRNVSSEALVYNSYFFQNSCFLEQNSNLTVYSVQRYSQYINDEQIAEPISFNHRQPCRLRRSSLEFEFYRVQENKQNTF